MQVFLEMNGEQIRIYRHLLWCSSWMDSRTYQWCLRPACLIVIDVCARLLCIRVDARGYARPDSGIHSFPDIRNYEITQRHNETQTAEKSR